MKKLRFRHLKHFLKTTLTFNIQHCKENKNHNSKNTYLNNYKIKPFSAHILNIVLNSCDITLHRT